jgi:hypothetical protein
MNTAGNTVSEIDPGGSAHDRRKGRVYTLLPVLLQPSMSSALVTTSP